MQENLVWAEVDLEAFAHNCREVRKLIPSNTLFMAVVKANAYGHGAVEISRRALHNGADFLGVARLSEGIYLRSSGISSPILILGAVPRDMMDQLWEYDLRSTVFDIDMASDLDRQARHWGKKIKIHLKVDTGMGRLGLSGCCFKQGPKGMSPKVISEIEELYNLPGLEPEGIYTHLARADEDLEHARKQLDCFRQICFELKHKGLSFPLAHAANSAGVISLPEAHLDLVRPGIMLYGLYPEQRPAKSKVSLKPVMALKSRIIQLKKVPAGFEVSYGSTYVTPCSTTIATVPIGYGDGYPRVLSSKGEVLVRGTRAKVAGRVCMDQIMLDVGHIDTAQVGDEVVLIGRQGQEEIRAEEIGAWCSTINYEVVTQIMSRVPRVYL